MPTVQELKRQLARKAVVFEIGGFRPSSDPFESQFGRVTAGMRGEEWPQSGGKPMLALCQINLSPLPFRPPRLDDFDMLAVFIDADELPDGTPNGEGWCVRTYTQDQLIPLPQHGPASPIKPFGMRARLLEQDFPCHDDVSIELPDDIADRYYDLFANTRALKLGGWPSLIQSEIYWAPWNKHPAAPEFVFQIDSSEKANWSWGDGGTGYFGRGTAPGRENEWAIEWQCY